MIVVDSLRLISLQVKYWRCRRRKRLWRNKDRRELDGRRRMREGGCGGMEKNGK